jgi:hypothetical protein
VLLGGIRERGVGGQLRFGPGCRAALGFNAQAIHGPLGDRFGGIVPFATIEVAVLPDTAFELPETFRLILSNPLSATLVRTQVRGTILNDDFPRPSRFQRIQHLSTSGHFRLVFDVGDNEAEYVVEASDDLRVWAQVGVVTGAQGQEFEFTDTGATNRVRRFYRTLVP